MYDCAGYGVYALDIYDPGCFLPLTYPGVTYTSEDDFIRLNKYLVSLTHQSPDAPYRDALKLLKEKWNGSIVPQSHTNPNMGPCWDTIYDNFIAYRMENTYWNVFYWDGSIKADISVSNHAALYINEAPQFDAFRNAFNNKIQRSAYNVDAIEGPHGTILFKAKRKICYGDELLMDYGPWYKRNYPVLDDSEDTHGGGIFSSNAFKQSQERRNALQEMRENWPGWY